MTTLRLPPVPPLSGTLARLPDGRAAIPATLVRMWTAIEDGPSRVAAYSVARQLTQHLRQKDIPGEADAVFRFVRDRIRYVRDPHGLEALQTPAATLTLKTGDCDDKTILLAALLQNLGIPVILVAGGFAPHRFVHVWLRGQVRGRWVAMDPTEPRPLGWEPPMIYKLTARPRNTADLAGMGGLGKSKWAKKLAPPKRFVAFVKATVKPPTSAKDIRKISQTLTEAIVDSPGMHLLPKATREKVEERLREAPLIPANWGELVKRMKAENYRLQSIGQYVSPSIKAHYQHESRLIEMKTIRAALRQAELDMKTNPTPEKLAYMRQLLARMGVLAGKEKTYNKNGFIVATVVSIVLTIFTFGAGTLAWQAFVQAVGKGVAAAVNQAAQLLLSLIKSNTKATAEQMKQVEYTLRAMTANPPPAAITKPEEQIQYSLTRQAEREIVRGEQVDKEGSLFPGTASAIVALKVLLTGV
mgnify:FL=1